ncbi:FecCD family ABC transporter permease [Qingshengfaniella alkalisoli]|uniref:Iron ABC transporter permease n=1 Tax=Qingshengfaniella alkalisoli TaxID=2599296 RepID=A0A5B8I5E0_9RHOB|nr:iron ABC transporter permease [Qingshengfaniella alkalisoli]QDY68475.1 iron ABC transporter permease [Qingshengfaniella alkalisoli]
MTRMRVPPVAVSLCAMGLLALLGLRFGARSDVHLGDLFLLFQPLDQTNAISVVLIELRLPRILCAVAVGGALGIAGALMQTATRNPLADPGLLGVNAGAAVGVVLTIIVAGHSAPSTLIIPALAGAALTTLLVWGLASLGTGMAALILAGAAVTGFLYAIIRGVLVLSQQALDVYRHWILGSLGNVSIEGLVTFLPMLLAGVAAAGLAARRLDALALGDDMGRTLGVGTGLTLALTLIAIACLCAAAVAIAGPIGFVGLIAPHMARRLGVSSTAGLAVQSALLGASLVLLADLAGRVILPGMEIQTGLCVALIGGPAIALIARGSGRLGQ